jgi:hypothetical protein
VSVPSPAATTQVQLERTSSVGTNPFSTPVGQDQPNITASANTGGTFSGDTPGLFADTGDKPSCDAQTLIANLEADPAKATAWATALGLQSQDIPTYVPSLTPVVLRSDTAVTSYGYADGRFFAYPAVLQAGTAVFVNSYGEPKAKCFSGNPLTQPVSNSTASYVGAAWEQFTPNAVTVIQRPPTVIVNYTFVDVYKGTTVHRRAKPPRKDDSNWHCKRNADSDQCGGVKAKVTDSGKPAKEEPVDNGQNLHKGGAANNTKTDTAKTDTTKTDTTKTDTGKTDTGKTDTGKTDTGKTDTGKTDTGKTDTGKTDTGKTDTGKTDTGKTDTGKTDTTKTGAGGSN